MDLMDLLDMKWASKHKNYSLVFYRGDNATKGVLLCQGSRHQGKSGRDLYFGKLRGQVGSVCLSYNLVVYVVLKVS